MNRVVNKYILHNRSIFFENDDEVEQFLEKRRDENSKKHKQPSSLNVKANLDKLSLGDMQVFRFNFRHESNNKILYLHGGYNTLQPSPFHWRFIDKLTLATIHEVVLPIYPKAPDYHIEDTEKAVRDVYHQLVDEVGAEHIIVMGDGSGGALALNSKFSSRTTEGCNTCRFPRMFTESILIIATRSFIKRAVTCLSGL